MHTTYILYILEMEKWIIWNSENLQIPLPKCEYEFFDGFLIDAL